MIEVRDQQILVDGEPRLLFEHGTVVLDDPAYVVDQGPGGTVRVSGGPGPITIALG